MDFQCFCRIMYIVGFTCHKAAKLLWGEEFLALGKFERVSLSFFVFGFFEMSVIN